MANEMQMVETQGFTQEQLAMLESPLDANLIKQRPDGKKYLKGSTEFDAANRVFGFGRWGYRVISRTLQKVFDLDDKLTGLYFYVEVELFVAGALFPFYGDGGQSVKYYTPQGYEDASKGATTDAVKRALRHYGAQFGLPLYDEDALVDAGDGVLMTVKEVRPNSNGQQKRVIDAGRTPKQLPPAQPTKPTIRTLCEAGIKKAMWKNFDEFCAGVSALLGGIAINNDVLKSLSVEQMQTIQDAIEAEGTEAA